MSRVRDSYLNKLPEGLTILDVGGRGLNNDRSYRSVWDDRAGSYCVADIKAGLGVTHVMPGYYELPFDDHYCDLVVSGQTLEHVRNPFRLVAEMRRVLKPGGYMVLIAPSAGPRHDELDCWRFMDDAFKAIAEELDLVVIADWIDNGAPDERSRKWRDHVFVGRTLKL
jgi:SAM-dependent methyltransferase